MYQVTRLQCHGQTSRLCKIAFRAQTTYLARLWHEVVYRVPCGARRGHILRLVQSVAGKRACSIPPGFTATHLSAALATPSSLTNLPPTKVETWQLINQNSAGFCAYCCWLGCKVFALVRWAFSGRLGGAQRPSPKLGVLRVNCKRIVVLLKYREFNIN